MIKLTILVLALAAFMLWRSRRNPVGSATAGDESARLDSVEPLEGAIGTPEADAQTLRALQDAGADLTKVTEVNYYMYFPTRAVAQQAAVAATNASFKAVIKEGADGDNWLCLATAHMVPSETAIREATQRFLGIAQSLGGDYDGWEAAVTS